MAKRLTTSSQIKETFYTKDFETYISFISDMASAILEKASDEINDKLILLSKENVKEIILKEILLSGNSEKIKRGNQKGFTPLVSVIHYSLKNAIEYPF